MDRRRIRQRMVQSSLGRAAALPKRLSVIARHDLQVLGDSAAWMVQSREYTNFTYDLTPLNREHLAWFCSLVTGRSVCQIRGFFAEIEQDAVLAAHIQRATAESAYRHVADRRVRFGRRIAWYAITRALEPEVVVETGTDKGLGSLVFASALLRNGHGHVTTVDIVDGYGWLISGPWASVIDRRTGDSLDLIPRLGAVDLFLHDSLHTRDHETAELEAVGPRLAGNAVVLSDNAHATDALSSWAEATGRRFCYFGERPDAHWYAGAGIGAALPITDGPA